MVTGAVGAPARMGSERAGRGLLRAALLGVALAMVVGLSATLAHEQGDGYRELVERFHVRAEVTAGFLSSYVLELTQRERTVAEGSLAGLTVSTADFREAALSFGFPAAVLLDGAGRALATVPDDQRLIGQDLAARYEHLRGAVHGRVTVSNVVPSAVRAEPVVAFAVPYQSAAGRRVFSGALAVAETALGKAYLSEIAPFPGARAYLVDAHGRTIASSARGRRGPDVLERHDPLLHRAIRSRTHGTIDPPEGPQRFASASIGGTPWRLVIAVPEAALFQPLDGLQRWLPWALLAGMLASVGVVVALLLALARSQRRQLGDLGKMTLTDPLTGLYNPRGFDMLARQELRVALRERTRLMVLFLDVDGLKLINDTRGHAAGNEAIVATAQVLREVLRDSDVVARLGGDEFCVVGRARADDHDAERLLARLRAALHRAAADRRFNLSVSAGVTWFEPDAPRPLDDLVREADERMYRQKQATAGRTAPPE